MKKTTAALLGAILIASTAHAQYQLDGIIRDGVVGGVIGGVIGNNTGDRDTTQTVILAADIRHAIITNVLQIHQCSTAYG